MNYSKTEKPVSEITELGLKRIEYKTLIDIRVRMMAQIRGKLGGKRKKIKKDSKLNGQHSTCINQS